LAQRPGNFTLSVARLTLGAAFRLGAGSTINLCFGILARGDFLCFDRPNRSGTMWVLSACRAIERLSGLPEMWRLQ
jgi:hypothetical protein